jgi:hypothetical protein
MDTSSTPPILVGASATGVMVRVSFWPVMVASCSFRFDLT